MPLAQAGGQRAGKRVRLEFEDVEAIRQEGPLKAGSAEDDESMGVKVGTRVVSNMVKAIELPYGPMRRLDVEEGRYFEEGDYSEHRNVLGVGPDAARRLFLGRPALGANGSVNGRAF